MTPEHSPSRHDLAWLHPWWRKALRGPADPDALPAVEAWFARGLPAVVCRLEDPLDESVGLGIAFPARLGRARVGLRVAPGAVASLAPPLRLGAAVASAPAHWQGALAELDSDAERAGLSLGVYGSLAWQHLSGEPYVTGRSDVDLLVAPRDLAELARALGLLGARACREDPRLDGEVLLGGGRGVAWRELLSPGSRVLLKSGRAATLVSLREALGGLPGGRPS